MHSSILGRVNSNIYSCFFWLKFLHIIGEAFEVPCEPGWTLSPVSGSCLKPSQVKKSWTDARRSCQAEDADLVKILDTKMNNFILNLNSRIFPIFIGLARKNGHLHWKDEKSLATYSFERFVNSNAQLDQSCVIMLGNGSSKGKWDNVPCLSEHRYYCEKGPDLCPAEWLPSNASGTCIKVFLDHQNVIEARRLCQQHGGDLVTILSPEMNDFIGDQISSNLTTIVHTGLNNLHNKTIYRWLHYPEKLSYTNWDPLDKGRCKKICSVVLRSKLVYPPSAQYHWYTEKMTMKAGRVCEKYTDCKNEKYGMICPAQCSEHCVNRTCHVKSGRCYYGCEPGFGGMRCDTRTDYKFHPDIFDLLRQGLIYIPLIFPVICLLGIYIKRRQRGKEPGMGEGDGQDSMGFQAALRASFLSEVTVISPTDYPSFRFESMSLSDEPNGMLSISALQKTQAWINSFRKKQDTNRSPSKSSEKSENPEQKSQKSIQSEKSQRSERSNKEQEPEKSS